jgi:hypothetical protein
MDSRIQNLRRNLTASLFPSCWTVPHLDWSSCSTPRKIAVDSNAALSRLMLHCLVRLPVNAGACCCCDTPNGKASAGANDEGPSAALQKHWIPRYTRAGFKKTRAPPLLFALLKVCAVSAGTTLLPQRYWLRHNLHLQVPTHTHIVASLTTQEFFEKHKNNSVIENWTDDNIYVNHEQSRRVCYIYMPHARLLKS